MARRDDYAAYGLIAAFSALFAIGASARIWERLQPKIYLPQTEIVSIEPYSLSNDLHWTSEGYRVHIRGEDRPIDFPLENWDETVEEGNIVDLVVRRSFPWFGLADELDGLSINDYK